MVVWEGSIELLCSRNNGKVEVFDSDKREEYEELLFDRAEEEGILDFSEADEGEMYVVVVEGEYIVEKETRFEPGFSGIEITNHYYYLEEENGKMSIKTDDELMDMDLMDKVENLKGDIDYKFKVWRNKDDYKKFLVQRGKHISILEYDKYGEFYKVTEFPIGVSEKFNVVDDVEDIVWEEQNFDGIVDEVIIPDRVLYYLLKQANRV